MQRVTHLKAIQAIVQWYHTNEVEIASINVLRYPVRNWTGNEEDRGYKLVVKLGDGCSSEDHEQCDVKWAQTPEELEAWINSENFEIELYAELNAAFTGDQEAKDKLYRKAKFAVESFWELADDGDIEGHEMLNQLAELFSEWENIGVKMSDREFDENLQTMEPVMNAWFTEAGLDFERYDESRHVRGQAAMDRLINFIAGRPIE